MFILERWILFFSLILLSGCSTTNIKLDSDTRSNVLSQGVTLNPIVKISDQPVFVGTKDIVANRVTDEVFNESALIGFIFLPVVGIVYGTVFGIEKLFSKGDEKNKIKQYLEDDKIDVASLVLTSFKDQINYRTSLIGPIRENGKYLMELEINSYGLVVEKSFSSKCHALLKLTAILKNAESKAIWYGYWATGQEETSVYLHPCDDYFLNPGLFKTALELEVNRIVSRVIDGLN